MLRENDGKRWNKLIGNLSIVSECQVVKDVIRIKDISAFKGITLPCLFNENPALATKMLIKLEKDSVLV